MMIKCFLPTYQRYIIWLHILVILLFFTGCGTFPLAKRVIPPMGKTNDQQRLDTLTCKDRARLEANTAERQTGAFLLGMTIIGAPLAFELEKAKQREVYAKCMRDLGYTVVPVEDENTPKKVSVPERTESSARDDVKNKMEDLKNMRDRGLITEEEYKEKKKEILDRM
jgi:hypothetical protein